MEDDSDHLEFSDHEIDDKKHDKIIANVLNLNKVQNVKSPYRTEPTTQISEFNLVKSLSNNHTVHINELTKTLKDRRKHAEIVQKLKSVSGRTKTLLKPLEKPQAERIKRTLNYEKSRLQLDRWEALVASNRSASQLRFPLGSVEKVKTIEKEAQVYPSTFRVKSELQKKIEALEPKVEEYRIDTDEANNEFPLTLSELKEKRKEAAKLRAHQHFKEAKARRQNKIKSKKYHRILRREKIKQKLKEFEELQKTNPEEALKKLDDIEKARAEERFSLRHKGTGQWARNKQVRAKYDKESRKELAQQLAVSRELTQKTKLTNSDSEDEAIESSNLPSKQANENNPWVNGVKPSKDVTDFVSGYRKFWNEVNSNAQEVNETDECEKPQATPANGVKMGKNKMKKMERTSNKNKPLSTLSNKVGCEKPQTTSANGVKMGKNKMKKMERNKNANKPPSTSSNNVSSTSDWEVSTIEAQLNQPLDVQDMFGIAEDKLNKKLNQKLKKIENKPESNNIKTNKKPKGVKQTFDLTIPKRNKKQIIDEEMLEQPRELNHDDNVNDNASENLNLTALKSIISNANKPDEPVNINPDKFIRVKQSQLDTAVPDISITEENEEGADQRDLIMEAFEDDDIAVDFEKEKAEEIDKDTPKDIDLNLPGWGSWAGTGINPNKRKNRRFIIKMPKKVPRRDANKGALIINEKAQAKIKPLLVSELPFPFKSVKDYEASIRAPIGRTFVPEKAFQKFIRPSVVTKMGAIIKPIDRSILTGVKIK
ncbi:unnamed protein product [Phyllotreta striolata]|uniref:U3 small nucleolar RNA-associated protein 14 n=1 Tax=Phyllotreta striolata TaxID=444603 RepID=A0A9N9TM88_PHYSR|nr:unnamed protein product [Phyllotreta striolata]